VTLGLTRSLSVIILLGTARSAQTTSTQQNTHSTLRRLQHRAAQWYEAKEHIVSVHTPPCPRRYPSTTLFNNHCNSSSASSSPVSHGQTYPSPKVIQCPIAVIRLPHSGKELLVNKDYPPPGSDLGWPQDFERVRSPRRYPPH
jgi:hypothetical protein